MGHELVEQTTELALDIDVAVRAPDDAELAIGRGAGPHAPAGQVDYVAANAYLNAYADSRAGVAGRRTLAIHWGVWNQVGLAARALRGESSTTTAAERLRATTQPLWYRQISMLFSMPPATGVECVSWCAARLARYR